jgi:hypothetical protein
MSTRLDTTWTQDVDIPGHSLNVSRQLDDFISPCCVEPQDCMTENGQVGPRTGIRASHGR